MHYQAILFDLDGTLLPMDIKTFTRAYFGALAKELAFLGIAPDALLKAVWSGTEAMVRNDGQKPNADVFWELFSGLTGLARSAVEPVCDRFYSEGFHQARAATGENPLAVAAVRAAREKADRVILATNPLFPMAGQATRLSWIGLKPEDFDLVTCYTSDRFCKPNPAYYTDICQRMNLQPDRCLMIGNDDREDMYAAQAAGIPGYLVTDCRIPAPDAPWTGPQGSFAEMVDMLKAR
ncbi:MAG: HAD family hydrolase [Aristaeellaceae bacterium]